MELHSTIAAECTLASLAPSGARCRVSQREAAGDITNTAVHHICVCVCVVVRECVCLREKA